MAALTATVAADKAAIETARLNLQYTEIAAPISGRTGALGAHVGDLVRANDTTPLVMINQLSPVYVTFSVPGRFLADIRRYQAQRPLVGDGGRARWRGHHVSRAGRPRHSSHPAAGFIDVEPGPRVRRRPRETGVVSFIDNVVDSATGTIRLKATFPNGDRQLWPGAFVQVTLDLTTDPDALVVPATAVQASQDGQYVYVVKADQTVEMRPVRIERQQSGVTVVAEGVSAGEVVVTDGQLRLAPGARVGERDAGGPRDGRAR